jgi:hypothetical protein
LIRCEGYIPKSPLARGGLGAEPRVCTLSQIPYENNHIPLLARGWLIFPRNPVDLAFLTLELRLSQNLSFWKSLA